MNRFPSPESDSDQGNYEYKFALNITPNDYPAQSGADLKSNPPFDHSYPIVPSNDGLLTAPDGSTLTPYSVLELSEKSATTQRRQRKRTHDRNGEYIPRPPNPFILFRCWYTAKVHKPGSHDSSEGSLSRLCGQEWQNLGVTQRRIFEEAAKIEKVKHAERYPNYRYKPIHKKGKKAAAAAAAAAAMAIQPVPSHYLEDDDEYRPRRTAQRRVVTHPPMPAMYAPPMSHGILQPTPTFPGAVPPSLMRHRRSSSVPIGLSDMMNLEASMRPIELPPAPFLALAGQDLPTRKSRGSLGFSQFGWGQLQQQQQQQPQQWLQQDGALYDYRALRSSIAGLHSLPASPSGRRAQLPAYDPIPYSHNHHAIQEQPNFYHHQQQHHQYAEEPSSVQWTNPNPFAASSVSEPELSDASPFAQTVMVNGDSSSCSSSAPSPPADLEISPLQQVANSAVNTAGIGSEPPLGHSQSNHLLPFDMFKSPIDEAMDHYAMGGVLDINGRPRGLSILGMGMEGFGMNPSGANHPSAAAANTDAYAHALRSEGLMGEIQVSAGGHDEIIMDHYLATGA